MAGSELFPIFVEDAAKPARVAVGITLANAWQGLLGDKILAWRLARAAKLNEKLAPKLAESGFKINLDTIPEGFAFKWFEQATQEEDDDILDLFATLLANAAGGNEAALNKRNIELVSRLSPDDAQMLAFLREKQQAYIASKRFPRDPFEIKIDWDLDRELLKESFDFESASDSLIALGVIRLENVYSLDDTGVGHIMKTARDYGSEYVQLDLSSVMNTASKLMLTTVGQSLLEALFNEPNKP
jgi:hypothetical protein